MPALSRFAALAAALGVAAALALPALAAAPATPRGTLQLEVAYLKSGQFAKLYALYGPKFRAACPYAKWLAQAKKAQPDFKAITLKVTKQTITGTRAVLEYQYLVNGKNVHTTKGDLFVKIAGGWYDEYDKVTLC